MHNKIVLIGRSARSAEIKTTKNGFEVAKISMATSRRAKINGEWQDVTHWHNVVVMAKGAVNLAKHIGKGDLILIEGSVETRSYTGRDGEKKYITEIVVRDYHGSLQILSRKGESAQSAGEGRGGVREASPHSSPNKPKQTNLSVEDLDDEIPF